MDSHYKPYRPVMENELRKDNGGFNALSMMTDSGARGSKIRLAVSWHERVDG